ncbi:trichohyalin [Planoprotostelium fungivorum]|uniref:Trichohyalin n=1 Tax=Planoprotostelium fungivorum TaxID=1890364 RepID=A0A2P6MVL8_9EUKA|nr:trichohyalin [Planoprotostelium fungivorum]
MAADRRKIQRLEEELAESETVRKKLERENKRLERDLKEAQETLDGKSADIRKEEMKAKINAEGIDHKANDRKMADQAKEIERLENELRIQKDRLSDSNRAGREGARAEVDVNTVRSQYETKIDTIRAECEKEKALIQHEMTVLREELDKAKHGRKPPASRAGALDRLSGDKEVEELKKKLAIEKESHEREMKKANKEKMETEAKGVDAIAQRDRVQKKLTAAEEENKRLTKDMEKENENKWQLEKSKLSLEKDIKDIQRQLKDSQAEGLKLKEELNATQAKMRNMDGLTRDSASALSRFENQIASTNKVHQEELSRQKNTYEAKINRLEDQIKTSRLQNSKTEESTEMIIENSRLQREIEKMKSTMEDIKDDHEREKKRIERANNQAKANLNEEELQREERRRKNQEATLPTVDPSANVSPSKSAATIDINFDKELERQRGMKLEDNVNKLRETIQQMDKKHQVEIDELKNKLQDRERVYQSEKNKWMTEQESQQTDFTSERKKLLEREKKKASELDQQAAEAAALQKRLTSADEENRRLFEQLRDATDNLEDEREERKIDSEKNGVLQEELDEKTSDLNEAVAELKKVENALRQAEDNLKETTRSLEDTKLTLDDTVAQLNETEERLNKHILEAKKDKETLTRKLEGAQREAEMESKEKEKQIKKRQEAEKRASELDWYFLPLEDQKDNGDIASPANKLLKRMRREIQSELENIRGRHTARDTSSASDIHPRLVQALANIPDTNKEATAYQLQGLVQSLEEASYDINTRLSVALAVTENLVDPEIIRELRIITESMLDQDCVLHHLETPDAVVRLALREIDEEKASPDYQTKKRSEVLTFRDALLNRLAEGRARRMPGVLVEDIKIGILDEIYNKSDS